MRFILSSTVLSIALAAGVAVAQETADPVSEPAASRSQIPTMMVTAQRRVEALRDVPIALSAFDEAALIDRQINAVVDVVGTVPNVHISNNIGQGSAVTAFIRGVGDTESILSIDNPVGFYLDDVYLGRTGVNNLFLFDVARVEVLRGPQGTLYGRNTSAGAIKIVSNKPVFDFEGKAEASYGRFDEWRLKGLVNVPVNDKIAIRLSGQVGGGGGDTYNIANDTRVNDAKAGALKLGVLANLSDDLTFELNADWARSNQNGRYAVGVFGVTPPPTESLYIINTDEVMRNVAKAWGVSGVFTWDVSDTMTLKSITAFRNTQQQYNLESSDQPATLFTVYSDVDSDQFSQEFQITGTAFGGQLNYVAGLYYFNERGDSFIGDFIGQFFWLNKDLNVDTDSYAAYAQVDYDITDRLTLIVGARFTRDEKSVDLIQRLGGTPGFEPGGDVLFDTDDLNGQIIPARPDDPVKTDLNFSKFTPKVGLEFAVNESHNVYFTYTQGFKSGGWSARVFFDPQEFFDFDPEEINSFELGAKGDISDFGTYSLAAFYYDYQNLFNTGTTEDGFGIATSNAEIYGIELETTWALAEGHTAFFNISWQDGDRKSVSQSSIVLGDKLQRLAEWQIGAGFTGEVPISNGLSFIYSASYSFMSEHFVDPQNSPEGRNGSIHLVNALIGVKTSDEQYRLTVGCRNCFGENYIEQLLNFPAFGFITVYPGERSHWTVTLSANF